MIGIILIIVGIIAIILGFTYFAKKTIWVLLGIALAIVGAYFLFFSASPVADDTGNGLTPGVGPEPVDFDQPGDETQLISLYGIVIDYYECGPGKTCIEMLGEEGPIMITTMIDIELEGVIDIIVLGYFDGSTFIAEDVTPITTTEELS